MRFAFFFIASFLLATIFSLALPAHAETNAAAPQNSPPDSPPVASNDAVTANAAAPIYDDPKTGTYCRQYSQDVWIEGHLQENYGTVCLQADGSWRITQ